MEHIAKLFGSGLRFRSHIWLEGQRLNEHGFKLGAEYTQVWLQDRVICVIGKLDAFVTPTGEQAKLFHRKVNKQGDNPAVRIEGKRVQKLFGEKYTNVKATFSQGRIVIEGNELVNPVDRSLVTDQNIERISYGEVPPRAEEKVAI